MTQLGGRGPFRPRFWRRRWHLVVSYGALALLSSTLAVAASIILLQTLTHMVARH